LVDDENARAQTFAVDGVLEHLDLDAGNERIGKRRAVDCAPFLGVSRCSSHRVGDGAPTPRARSDTPIATLSGAMVSQVSSTRVVRLMILWP
jgi:hypothetical protein